MAEPMPVQLEWDDFLALDDDDRRELIDGELVEVDVPTKLHEWIVMCLGYHLTAWARVHGGLPLASGYKVRVSRHRGVHPDLQFYRKGHEHLGGLQGLEDGAPDLAVEVVSPSSRSHDRVRKLGWYRDIGVPEYWLVDPEARTLERLILEGSAWKIADALAGEALFRPATFPALEIPLAELWTPPGG